MVYFVWKRMFYNLNNEIEMECCFAPKRKNKPPTAREYEPYEPTKISRAKVLIPNDTDSINEEI